MSTIPGKSIILEEIAHLQIHDHVFINSEDVIFVEEVRGLCEVNS